MNGIEATKAIRRLDNPWAASIPIIAMTADAFSENVAECLAAGMNGHIAKPIDMKLVMKEIKQIKEESKT
jgi:CheY-like chemotaxis protein